MPRPIRLFSSGDCPYPPGRMETRRLGNTDLDLTPVGFGTWAIGGGDWGMGWGPQEETDSIG